LPALRLLVKELSLRGTVEVLEVKLDTVRHWLRGAAQPSTPSAARRSPSRSSRRCRWMISGPSRKKRRDSAGQTTPRSRDTYTSRKVNIESSI
jgi:hypothetical protein